MTSSNVFDAAPRLIDIGNGLRMGVQVQGSGGPTVVFEAGATGRGIDGWFDLGTAVAEFATVVTYDRLGVGASEPQLSRYPTATDHANNLAKLLDLLPVQQPVIIVGWSWGGMMAQQFAALYPQKVSGLLLLDPSIFVEDDSPATMGGFAISLIFKLQIFALVWLKRKAAAAATDPAAHAALRKLITAGYGPHYPKEQLKKDFFLGRIGPGYDPGPAVAMIQENIMLQRHFRQTTAEVGRTIAKQGGLPKVPTLLLLSTWIGKNMPAMAVKMMKAKMGVYEKTAARLGIEMRKLKEISHQIPQEAPQESVRAVRDLIARINGTAT